LVVIGIIAIMIAILLPSLNAARRQAATLKCLSNLRQIGMAYQMYAHLNKQALPVIRQDTPDNGITPTNQVNWYWSDMILPLVSKSGKMNFQASGTNQQKDFDAAKASVLWGCPTWEGWSVALSGGISSGNFIGGITKYENGYSMNYWPTMKPGYPANPASLPPPTESAIRSTVVSVGTPQGPAIGKYFKLNQWSKPDEKMLICDSNLWLLGFEPVSTPGGKILGQNAFRAFASSPGANNIDRYRHGKFPKLDSSGTMFSTNGGLVRFNVLYVDGHAVTLSDIKEGYKAIRMQYP
jgi:prepilin-type processing-associated H-X9-DG protein